MNEYHKEISYIVKNKSLSFESSQIQNLNRKNVKLKEFDVFGVNSNQIL